MHLDEVRFGAACGQHTSLGAVNHPLNSHLAHLSCWIFFQQTLHNLTMRVSLDPLSLREGLARETMFSFCNIAYNLFLLFLVAAFFLVYELNEMYSSVTIRDFFCPDGGKSLF